MGIGVSNPVGTLDVWGNYVQRSGGIYLGADFGVGQNSISSGSNMMMYNAASSGHSFRSGLTEYMRLMPSGLGIHTNQISATLQVSGTARISSWTVIAANVTPTAELEVYGRVSASSSATAPA